MAKIPIQYAQRLPDVVQSPRANMNVDSGAGMIYEAMSRAGQVASGLGIDLIEKKSREDEKVRKNQIYAETQTGKIAIQKFDAETEEMLRGEMDVDIIGSVGKKRMSERSAIIQKIAKTPEAQQDLGFYEQQTAIGVADNISQRRFVRSQENAYVSFDGLYNQAAAQGNFVDLEPLAAQAYRNGVISEKEYANRKSDAPKLQEKWNVEKIRGMSQAAVDANGDKKEAYKIIDQSAQEGLIDAQSRVALRNSIDSYTEGSQYAKNAAKYEKSVKHYEDFSTSATQKTLKYEDVAASNLDDAEKLTWQNIIKEQYKTPDKVSPKGYKAVEDAVLLFSAGNTDKKMAIDAVMKARYIDKSITDTTAQWALEKIQKPYPQHLAPGIKGVLTDNDSGYNGWWNSSADKKKAQNVNHALLRWVDDKIANKKEPTIEEMHTQSALYRASIPDEYNVGDTTVRGGVTYEVVGYYPDGEPNYEKVD